MRRLAAAAMLLAFATACVKTGSGGVELTVAAPTVTRHDGHIGLGTTLRVRGAAAVNDIQLVVRFLDAGGELVREEAETLPSCSARCLWGASYVADGPERTVVRAEVDVRRFSRSDDRDVESLEVADMGKVLRVHLPEQTGRAILLALDGGKPIYGVTFAATRRDDHIDVPSQDLPGFDGLAAFFYAGASEGGEPGAD